MIYRTRYQRESAVSALMNDLLLRTTNPVMQEYAELSVILLGGLPGRRKAIEPRVAELIAAAERRKRAFEKRLEEANAKSNSSNTEAA